MPNAGPNIYRTTVVGTNDYDQAGTRIDYNASSKDQFFCARLSFSGGYDYNPVSVRGTPIPGFPTRGNLKTDSAEASNTHTFSPALTNSFRASFCAISLISMHASTRRLQALSGSASRP
jgi:hypothetical protein